jgi:hypothetical protein
MISLEAIFETVNRQNVTCIEEGPKCLAMVEGKCLLFAKDKSKEKNKRQKDKQSKSV